VTPDQLRTAIWRTLRSYGLNDADAVDVLDDLVSIADHHAAEESAAAYTDAAAGT
jgi:hypothetical protein